MVTASHTVVQKKTETIRNVFHHSFQSLWQSPITYTGLDFWLYWAIPQVDKFIFIFFLDLITFCIHSEAHTEDEYKQDAVIVFFLKKKIWLYPSPVYNPHLLKIQWNTCKLLLKTSFLYPAPAFESCFSPLPVSAVSFSLKGHTSLPSSCCLLEGS